MVNRYILFLLILGLTTCGRKNRTEKYKSGQIKFECDVDEDGLRHGDCVYYYANGEVKSVNSYKNDTLYGLSEFYHENGKLSWKAYYKGGSKNGNVIYYDSLGNIFQSLYFKEDRFDSVNKVYYPNGKLKNEVNYKIGMPTGIQKKYDSKGRLVEEAWLNEKGEQVDFIKYDSIGEVTDSFLKALFELREDKGKEVLHISVNEPLGEEFLVIVGELDSLNGIVKDTIVLQNSFSDIGINIKLDKPVFFNHSMITGELYDIERIDGNKATVKRHRMFKFDLKSGEERFFKYFKK